MEGIRLQDCCLLDLCRWWACETTGEAFSKQWLKGNGYNMQTKHLPSGAWGISPVKRDRWKHGMLSELSPRSILLSHGQVPNIHLWLSQHKTIYTKDHCECLIFTTTTSKIRLSPNSSKVRIQRSFLTPKVFSLNLCPTMNSEGSSLLQGECSPQWTINCNHPYANLSSLDPGLLLLWC